MGTLNTPLFVGDISVQDADILAKYAENAKDILEFGVGGSTMVLAQHALDSLVSVETDNTWVDSTKRFLAQLDTKTEVEFTSYRTNFASNAFDVIFVDGVDDLRRAFASDTWASLKAGGYMLFHDTRREEDVSNVLAVVQQYCNEVASVVLNEAARDGNGSNISVVQKKDHEPYVSWHEVEGKPLWAYGYFHLGYPLPEDWLTALRTFFAEDPKK